MLEFNHVFFFLPLSRVKWMKMSRRCLNKFYQCAKANRRKSKPTKKKQNSLFSLILLWVFIQICLKIRFKTGNLLLFCCCAVCQVDLFVCLYHFPCAQTCAVTKHMPAFHSQNASMFFRLFTQATMCHVYPETAFQLPPRGRLIWRQALMSPG